MKVYILVAVLFVNASFSLALADNTTVNALLQDYAGQGSNPGNALSGEQLWQKTTDKDGVRSCASCHTKDLTKVGKHIKTNKQIKPMSPSVNIERLTDSKKVNKWFKRNCKWTFGRECTAQEKSDFLIYIENSSKLQE